MGVGDLLLLLLSLYCFHESDWGGGKEKRGVKKENTNTEPCSTKEMRKDPPRVCEPGALCDCRPITREVGV